MGAENVSEDGRGDRDLTSAAETGEESTYQYGLGIIGRSDSEAKGEEEER